MERNRGEQGGLPARMGKADKGRGRFGEMAGGADGAAHRGAAA